MAGDARPLRWKYGSIVTVISLVSIVTLYLFWHTSPTVSTDIVPVPATEELAVKKTLQPWDNENAIHGRPTAKFRDNVKDNGKYMTTWSESSGYTNDVIAFLNMIYMSVEADRIPILPPFSPSHHFEGLTPGFLPFGEVFDIPRLAKKLKTPILEWHDVKKTPANESDLETLGCWSVWQGTQTNDKNPRYSPKVHKYLGLDVSYTQVPDSVKLTDNAWDQHANFWGLIALSFPGYRAKSLRGSTKSNVKQVNLDPDQQLSCYDYTYYVAAFQPFETGYTNDFSPAWNFIGQHLHFTPRLNDIADQYVRKTLRIEPGQPTPDYIGAHIRRTDFKQWCDKPDDPDCFASMNVIGRRVQEIRNELDETQGLKDVPVIMTSDEEDPAWWQEARNMGYWVIDHKDTVANYGVWYPVLIDSVIQASGIGFVGTDRSTMSHIAKGRNEAWKDGITKMIKWGKKGADDH